MMKISCNDLKIQDCDYEASADASGKALSDMIEHLQDEHDMRLPDAQDILEGDVTEGAWDDKTMLLVSRMREALNLSPLDLTPDTAEEAKPATSAPAKPPRDA